MSAGYIFIIIGVIGLIGVVISFIVFIKKIGRKRFENFNASLTHKQYQPVMGGDPGMQLEGIIFSEEKKWHQGKALPGGVKSIGGFSGFSLDSDVYAGSGYSSDDLEATEKL